MIATTRKHHLMINGLSRFALVTVGRHEDQESGFPQPSPEILLNGYLVDTLTDGDLAVIESAQHGIRQAEADCDWTGECHFLLRIEGLLVDGIAADAARVAAREATEDLIAKRQA